MFERFTDRARKVMALANREAQNFNHEYIGTEHILLGLVTENSGVGAQVLKNLGVDAKLLRQEVEKLVKSGPDMVLFGKLPQTPRAKKVIEFAIEEARALNHTYVGTEHMLLGLLREGEGVAAQVLTNLGLELETVRQEVLNLLGVTSDSLPLERTHLPPLTLNAEKVLVRANQEALHYNHDCIASQHILLALAKEGTGRAARVLRNHRIDLKLLQREVIRLLKPGSEVVLEKNLPYTPVVRRVMAYAAKEAKGRREVGTEHLLLGLMWDGETVIARVLVDLGLRPDEIRLELERLDRDSYRDLPAWRKADELAYQVYLAAQAFPKTEVRGIAAELRGTALLIPLCIMDDCTHHRSRRFNGSFHGALRMLTRLRHLLGFARRMRHLNAKDHAALCELIDEVAKALREGVETQEQD